MNFKEYLRLQVEQALSPVNRYYFWKHYGRDAVDDNELIIYYAEFGAEIFAEKHRKELEYETRAVRVPE